MILKQRFIVSSYFVFKNFVFCILYFVFYTLYFVFCISASCISVEWEGGPGKKVDKAATILSSCIAQCSVFCILYFIFCILHLYFVFCNSYFSILHFKKKVDKAGPSCRPALRNADTRIVSWAGEAFKGFNTTHTTAGKGFQRV